MAITATVARHYTWRMIIIAAVCAVLGLWGLYDYAVKIPRQQQVYQQYEQIRDEIADLEALRHSRPLTATEAAEYDRLTRNRNELGTPKAPGKYDRIIKGLVFVPCLPFGLYMLWALAGQRRRRYALDDDGALHLPEGTWQADEIADIDMSRWMAKSIAYVVHRDGTRAKLDDYKHRNLHLIIGSIACRLYPHDWTDEARPIKASSTAGEGAEAPQADEDAASDQPSPPDRESLGPATPADAP